MSTTSFNTNQGTPVSVVVHLDADVTGATVTAEFGGSKFTSIALSKPVTVTGGRFATVSLTAAEVDQIKSAKYRIKAVNGGTTTYPAGGEIAYTKATTAQNVQVGAGARIYSGSGVPANTSGQPGDWYIRTDAPGTANQRLYVKGASTWTGIL